MSNMQDLKRQLFFQNAATFSSIKPSAATQPEFDRHPSDPGNRPSALLCRPKAPGFHRGQRGLVEHPVPG